MRVFNSFIFIMVTVLSLTGYYRSLTKEKAHTILITDVLIYDGSGTAPFMGSVRIEEEAIFAVGDLVA